MMRILFVLIIVVLFAGACLTHKKTTKTNDPYASDRTVTLQFHPSWGGMAACELERKNGNDQLTYTYIVRKPMGDSTYSTSAPVTKAQADSVFKQAENMEWVSDIFFGSAKDPVGLSVYGAYKRGPLKRNITCQRLKDATELPADVGKLAQLLNDLAPEDFKLY